jgi:ribonuclease VapC
VVIDTSALIAILASEAGAEELKSAIARDTIRLMSVASVLEASVVLESRFGDAGPRELDLIVRRLPIEIKPVDLEQLEWARFAFHTYGRGRHPAKLNFANCFSYALSKVSRERLLYTGADFAQTDLASAPAE